MSPQSSPSTLQATVEQYDTHTGSGTALSDEGVRWRFPGLAVAPSIRHLRGGQRVILHLSPTSPDTTQPSPVQPTVTSVTLLSVGAREG
jgi:hypothetical protein